jgi:hypothetical protein
MGEPMTLADLLLAIYPDLRSLGDREREASLIP